MAKSKKSAKSSKKTAKKVKAAKPAPKKAKAVSKRPAAKNPKAAPKKPAAKKPAAKKAKPAPKKPAPPKKVIATRASDTTNDPGSARVQAGSPAPRFELRDQSGNTVSSDSLRGTPYVLYFYPKDDTSGCTREACGFRDAGGAFGKLRTRIIGVSPDSEQSHARFAGKYGLPFTLLSDPEKSLAKAYGTWALKKNYGREYMGILRSTFVVDANGVIQRAFYGVKVDGHVDNVLAAVGSA